VKKYVTEIQGDKVLKLSSAGSNQGNYQGKEQAESSKPISKPELNTKVDDEGEGDLPF